MASASSSHLTPVWNPKAVSKLSESHRKQPSIISAQNSERTQQQDKKLLPSMDSSFRLRFAIVVVFLIFASFQVCATVWLCLSYIYPAKDGRLRGAKDGEQRNVIRYHVTLISSLCIQSRALYGRPAAVALEKLQINILIVFIRLCLLLLLWFVWLQEKKVSQTLLC